MWHMKRLATVAAFVAISISFAEAGCPVTFDGGVKHYLLTTKSEDCPIPSAETLVSAPLVTMGGTRRVAMDDGMSWAMTESPVTTASEIQVPNSGVVSGFSVFLAIRTNARQRTFVVLKSESAQNDEGTITSAVPAIPVENGEGPPLVGDPTRRATFNTDEEEFAFIMSGNQEMHIQETEEVAVGGMMQAYQTVGREAEQDAAEYMVRVCRVCPDGSAHVVVAESGELFSGSLLEAHAAVTEAASTEDALLGTCNAQESVCPGVEKVEVTDNLSDRANTAEEVAAPTANGSEESAEASVPASVSTALAVLAALVLVLELAFAAYLRRKSHQLSAASATLAGANLKAAAVPMPSSLVFAVSTPLSNVDPGHAEAQDAIGDEPARTRTVTNESEPPV